MIIINHILKSVPFLFLFKLNLLHVMIVKYMCLFKISLLFKIYISLCFNKDLKENLFTFYLFKMEILYIYKKLSGWKINAFLFYLNKKIIFSIIQMYQIFFYEKN